MVSWNAKAAIKSILSRREHKENLKRIDAMLTQKDIDTTAQTDRQFTRGMDVYKQDQSSAVKKISSEAE